MPVRGQVYVSDRLYDDELTHVLVISCDDWNRRAVREVLAVEMVKGRQDPEVPANLAPLVQVGEQVWTVYCDDVMSVLKEGLDDSGITLGSEAMADVDDVLRKVLALSDSPRGGRGVPRPGDHPYAGQVRYADLEIEGESAKPVVVVSSEYFGEQVSFEFVLACRVTGDRNRPRDFDVALSSKGKVVCSDLRTVAGRHLKSRTTAAAAVTATERTEIMQKVGRILGLG